DRIFKQAGQAWVRRGYITQAVSPDIAKDDHFLKEIYQSTPVERAAATKLPAPGPQVETKAALMTKPVNIFFGTNVSSLDANAQQLLDSVATLAQTYSNAYIRVEGNTDNVGNPQSNTDLSNKRAQAVIDFLVTKYSLDKNRFIAKGNGPNN